MVKKTEEQVARQNKKQEEERVMGTLMGALDDMNKSYPSGIFERATRKWIASKALTKQAQKEIAIAEQKLAEVKRRYGK